MTDCDRLGFPHIDGVALTLPDGLLEQADLLLQHGDLATDALLGHLARSLHLLERLLRLLAAGRRGVAGASSNGVCSLNG